MHFLAAHYRSEFLAVPELVRFTMAQGSDGLEATLLIKASTLTLKYLLRLRRFQVVVVGLSDARIGYGVQIHDDPELPATLWSIAERQDEIDALRRLIVQPKCVTFLFNELATSVAWADVEIVIAEPELVGLVAGAGLASLSNANLASEMMDNIHAMQGGTFAPPSFLILVPEVARWVELKSTYITNGIGRSMVSLSATDEGAQQEEVALWLIDNLHPGGAFRGPKVHVGARAPRELADLVLSHRYGAFLFESKALAILSRENLPNRAALTSNLKARLAKATKQLAGGLKNVRLGHKVTDQAGNEVELAREAMPHLIVLVPDLTLLSEAEEFGGAFLIQFLEQFRAFLHILDPAELLRMVQAAEMIEARTANVTRLMGFDFHLMKRFEAAVNQPSPELNFLIRFDAPAVHHGRP